MGSLENIQVPNPEPQLRRKNQIKTIANSLAIEGNTLTEDQISDILDGKKILAPANEILEVKNAIIAYDNLAKYNYKSVQSLYKAHKLMMTKLIKDAGRLRPSNAGIYKGDQLVHMAPPPKMLDKLMNNLFDYLSDDEEHLLIKSCVFHYEFEFIHPFTDGNGRTGRLWQSTILYNFNPIFQFIPIESLIKQKQKQYYDVLAKCDKAADSTLFVEFMLDIIHKSLLEFQKEYKTPKVDSKARIAQAKKVFKKKKFARKDYMTLFQNISTATASRDLKEATDSKLIKKIGDKRNSLYQFVNC